MKKQLLLLLISLFSLCATAQTNRKTLNYQAVILDPKSIDIPGASITGQPLHSGQVCLCFTLLNTNGSVDYEETQQITTDEFGLVSASIGTGAQTQASLSTNANNAFERIVWTSSVKSLKVSVSYDNCVSFKQVSTQNFTYTPYALYAEAVDYKNVRDAPTKLSQFTNDPGYVIPKDLVPMKVDILTNSQQIESANQMIAANKQTSDAAFLIVNQSLTSLGQQVAENANSLATISTKLVDQQHQIHDNRNQIVGLQSQLNTTNSIVNSLSGASEMQSNKSTATDMGGTNPSDQAYPSQKAAKAYVDQVISQIATTGVPDATTLAPGKIQLAGDLRGTATSPTVPGLTDKENTVNKSTDIVADAASDTKYPSVRAVKTYVDQVGAGTGGVPYSGATGPVDLGAYNLTVNGIVVGIGSGDNTNTSIGNASLLTNTGLRNTAYGNASLQANTVGNDNTAVGYFALQKNTARTNPTYIGNQNTAVGSFSLQSNTIGTRNTGTGAFSLEKTSTGYDNSANGYASLTSNTTGYRNTGVGSYALYYNDAGNENTSIGHFSMQQNTSGSGNTALGGNSLTKNKTGNNNTALGFKANVSLVDLSNATAIGYNAIVASSNSIVLGNSSVTSIGGYAAWANYSDRRIKKNIRDIQYGLSTVLQLRPVEYMLISSELKQVGFIAQEVNKLVPEVITGVEGDLEKGEILGITYANLVPVLTKAIQEQQKQMDGLHSQLEEQRKKIEELFKLMGVKNNR
jgi:hypothetical protein